MKKIQLSLEDEIHNILKKEQQERKNSGLRFLSLQKLAETHLRESLQQRHKREALHKLLITKQQEREKHGLPFLSLDDLTELYALEGMLGRHFLEQQEGIML